MLRAVVTSTLIHARRYYYPGGSRAA